MNPVATALDALFAALRAPVPSAPIAPKEPEFMTVAEFAQRLDVCERTVRNFIKAGMPHVRPSLRIVRIRVEAAERWLVEQTGRGSAARAMMLGRLASRRGREQGDKRR